MSLISRKIRTCFRGWDTSKHSQPYFWERNREGRWKLGPCGVIRYTVMSGIRAWIPESFCPLGVPTFCPGTLGPWICKVNVLIHWHRGGTAGDQLRAGEPISWPQSWIGVGGSMGLPSLCHWSWQSSSVKPWARAWLFWAPVSSSVHQRWLISSLTVQELINLTEISLSGTIFRLLAASSEELIEVLWEAWSSLSAFPEGAPRMWAINSASGK